jgi:hypothetical protein
MVSGISCCLDECAVPAFKRNHACQTMPPTLLSTIECPQLGSQCGGLDFVEMFVNPLLRML